MTAYILTSIAVLISLLGLLYQRSSYNRDKIIDAEKMGSLMQKVETIKEESNKTNAIEAKLSMLSENVVKLTENVKTLAAQMEEIKSDIKGMNCGH